jgi:single-strand DNA-binding protein
VNRVILIGFLGEAPELEFSSQGKPIGTFSLAVNERWKDVEGARRERVEWFQIVCFGRLAEVCGQYLVQGRDLFVEGRLQLRSYQDREGEKRNVTEVVVTTLRFLGPPKNGNGAKGAESSKAARPVDESDNPFNEPQSETADQDIPF